MMTSIPAFDMRESFCSVGVMIGGPFAPVMILRGCGSKVMTTDWPPIARALSLTMSKRERWPLCTPSKFPMVRTGLVQLLTA